MGNVDLAPEVDVIALEPLLSPHVVSELLDTYMSTLTVSRKQCAALTGCAQRWPLRRLSESDWDWRQRQKRAEPYLDVGCFWEFGFASHLRRVAPCPVLDLEIVWGVHSTGADPRLWLEECPVPSRLARPRCPADGQWCRPAS